MTEKKSGSLTFFWVILGLLLVIGTAYYLTLEPPPPVEPVADQQETATETPAETETSETTGGETEISTASVSEIDVEKALAERVLGNPDAPLKIAEFSSLTCSHCGNFHQNTYELVKKTFVDTDRAYIVFSDFPLNAPAMHASMVARCLPEENYFPFVQMLFVNQDDWAYDVGYLSYLKTKAAEHGLPEELFQACVQNTELQNGILERMKAAQGQWDIKSTPSFVINNKRLVTGAMPFDSFGKILNEELEKIESSPVTGETSAPGEEEVSKDTDNDNATSPENSEDLQGSEDSP